MTKDLKDGEVTEVQGSAAKPYTIKNIGGVYSCSCPAWCHQSLGIERRTCKHIKLVRGEAAEIERLSKFGVVPQAVASAKAVKKMGNSVVKDTAPPVLLAHKWDNETDLTGWWMSEKMDGVRAWWDGKVFISRLGNYYHAPKWFVEQLPDYALDGELWLERKKFNETISIVRRQDAHDGWKNIKYTLFDAPNHSGKFEDRQQFLQDKFGGNRLKYAFVLDQTKIQNMDQFRKELKRVQDLGGEGLMVRQPNSMYVAGRSNTLLKVKDFFDDEALVLSYQPGLGKYKGMMGALNCKMANGVLFAVGTGFLDEDRRNPPAIGSTITFRYQELSKDRVPRFPSYVGVRID
jgi:DNA ligase-1